MKVIIFGAGDLGIYFYKKHSKIFDILFFVDNQRNAPENEIPILHPSVIKDTEFDRIVIASAHGLEAIYEQLVQEFCVPREKICRVWGESFVPEYFIGPRIRFLEDFAEFCYLHGLEGACAEVGVCSGDFAKEINRVFPDKALYLFDTFDGFDIRDLQREQEINTNYSALESWIADGSMDFSGKQADKVYNRMPYKNNVTMKKGFFPETFDLSEELRFLFVNLDTDLYQPIKDGLEIFYPRMVKGGVILIHDYFSMLEGVEKAVDEFLAKNNLSAVPIGDRKSIAIIKQ